MANPVLLSPPGEGKVHVDQALDRISELSDDILFTILSSLEMKDAAKTSILSRRWRYLWTYRMDLDFDPLQIGEDKWLMYPADMKHKRSKYANWVNQVVSVHHGPIINKFKVDSVFDAPDDYSHIDTWVKFAISKRVRELYLDVDFFNCRTDYSLGFDLLKNSPCDSGISCLTSLDLIYVSVSEECLQFLLSRCHLLERLVVDTSKDLVRFKVANSSLKLKHLAIRRCRNLKQLEIGVASLMYFEYEDALPHAHPDISFRNVPLLVEATFGGDCCFLPFPIFPQMTCFAMQLSRLSINLLELSYGNSLPNQAIPCFTKVKHLVLSIFCDEFSDLLSATHFIRACPMLHDFTLEVKWLCDETPKQARELRQVPAYSDSDDDSEEENISEDEIEDLDELDLFESSEEEEAEDEPQLEHGPVLEPEPDLEDNKAYSTLGAIVLDGFIGWSSDVELIMHIVDFAPALKTIICKPWDEAKEDLITACKRRAYKLARILPPTVKVYII